MIPLANFYIMNYNIDIEVVKSGAKCIENALKVARKSFLHIIVVSVAFVVIGTGT